MTTTEPTSEQIRQVADYLDSNPVSIYEDNFAPLKKWAEEQGASFKKPSSKGAGATSPNKSASSSSSAPNLHDPNHLDPEHDPDPERWPASTLEYNAIKAKNNSESEEDLDRAGQLKAESQDLANDGNVDAAIKKMTEALEIKPESGMYWAARAMLYCKAKAAHCALKDAEKALEINNESARGLRARGIANRHLGHWEQAADDLNHANTVDFDEGSIELAKFCTERANKIRQARNKAHQEELEREELARLKEEQIKAHRARQQKEEEEEAAAAAASGGPGMGMGGGANPFAGMGGGGGGNPFAGMGGGGGAGGAGGADMGAAMEEMVFAEHPELRGDPEAEAAIKDIKANPMNLMKYMSHPKLGPAVQSMMQKAMGAAQAMGMDPSQMAGAAGRGRGGGGANPFAGMGGGAGGGGMPDMSQFANMMGGMGGGGRGRGRGGATGPAAGGTGGGTTAPKFAGGEDLD